MHNHWVGQTSNSDGQITYSQPKPPNDPIFRGFTGVWNLQGNVSGIGNIDVDMTNGQVKTVNINGINVRITFDQRF